MSEPNKPATVPSVDDVVLLPCPCCGGSVQSGCYDEGGGDEWWVECGKCELMLGNRKSEQDAREAWNRRDGDPCRAGCKIRRAVEEMANSATSDFKAKDVPSTSTGVDSLWR